MFEEKLERSSIHCASGSSNLLDAARQTPDCATLEVLFRNSLEELYSHMVGQAQKKRA